MVVTTPNKMMEKNIALNTRLDLRMVSMSYVALEIGHLRSGIGMGDSDGDCIVTHLAAIELAIPAVNELLYAI